MNRREYLASTASLTVVPTLTIKDSCPACGRTAVWMASDRENPDEQIINIYADRRGLDHWTDYCTVSGDYYINVLQSEAAEKYNIKPDFVYYIHQ